MAIHKLYYTTDKLTVENLEKILKDNLSSDYEITLNKKGGNVASKAISGNYNDNILISKNAYHRSIITLQEESEKTYIHFNEAPSKWWLKLLNKEFGFIGSIVLGLIYGNADEFYDSIEKLIPEKISNVGFDEIETGLGALKNLIKK